ncbi:MAG TPA: methyltransferase domain-containing protein [Anaerolineae bacterium]|nr:methyltransferase domain-containing protein [Anaerolineae bacterium]
MATVFMKWLETTPRDYERGIRLLTLGRLEKLHVLLTEDFIKPGMRVLEIGCGTGALARRMAGKGANVTAVDVSPDMLAEAQRQLDARDLAGSVSFEHMDATLIGERLPVAAFDRIVASLVFSELSPDEQRHVLQNCRWLLAPDGRLLIVDEVPPAGFLQRILFWLVRAPITLLTWILTRTTTRAVRSLEVLLRESRFRPCRLGSRLGGSLVLVEGSPLPEAAPAFDLEQAAIPRLRHRISLRSLLVDLWALFLRVIPPYPKVRPGLYAVGHPDTTSPVFVSGNFDLSVRRLVRELDGKVDAWLLVADSKGINVWCAAGGGYFTADSVIAAVGSSRIESIVQHRHLILPQLCANGVDADRIRGEIGWQTAWGPVRAEDIPSYLAGGKKTDAMRWLRFPLVDRLEMVSATLGLYAIMILIPLLIFWRPLFWPVAISLFGLSYFYGVMLPWLPGRDGLVKSIPLALIALAGLFAYVTLVNPLPPLRLFHWTIGLTGLSVFVAAELQGMSPFMRGEQANWGWELLIGIALGLIYWLVPMAVGWR